MRLLRAFANVRARLACRFVLVLARGVFATLRAYSAVDIPARLAFARKAPGRFTADCIHLSAI